MVLQVDGLGERQATDVALVILLARVQLPVRPERRVPRELTAADVAVEGLVASGGGFRKGRG